MASISSVLSHPWFPVATFILGLIGRELLTAGRQIGVYLFKQRHSQRGDREEAYETVYQEAKNIQSVLLQAHSDSEEAIQEIEKSCETMVDRINEISEGLDSEIETRVNQIKRAIEDPHFDPTSTSSPAGTLNWEVYEASERLIEIYNQ